MSATKSKRTATRPKATPKSTPKAAQNEVVAKLLLRSNDEPPMVISLPLAGTRKVIPTRMGNH